MPSKAPGRLERRLIGVLGRSIFYRGRRLDAPPGPEDLVLDGHDGARLAARWFPLEGRVQGVVVLAHPDKRRGKRWFEDHGYVAFLRAHGFEVLAFDFAAYGASRGGSVYHHEDVVAAARWAHREAGGLPVHVLGVSLGAFFAANAAPSLPFVDALVLESPYPSFAAWYEGRRGERFVRAFHRVFARSFATIDARRNLARAACGRVLVAATRADAVTPYALSRAVYEAAPADRRAWYESSDAPHLGLLPEPGYRSAVLAALGAWGQAETEPADAPSARGRTSAVPSAPP